MQKGPILCLLIFIFVFKKTQHTPGFLLIRIRDVRLFCEEKTREEKKRDRRKVSCNTVLVSSPQAIFHELKAKFSNTWDFSLFRHETFYSFSLLFFLFSSRHSSLHHEVIHHHSFKSYTSKRFCNIIVSETIKVFYFKFALVFVLTNSMAYGTRRFNAAFTRALQ